MTVVIAVACYFIIPSSYTTAYFLNEDDRAVMRKRAELTEAYSGGKGHYTRAEFMMAVKDVGNEITENTSEQSFRVIP